MIITRIIPYQGSKSLADELNMESAQHYNAVLTNHWRTFRKKGVWLSEKSAYRWEGQQSGRKTLHSHSRNAARTAFYRACKTARTLKRNKHSEARYPHRRTRFRTTVWTSFGIRRRGDQLLLSRMRGLSPIVVSVSEEWAQYKPLEVRLVYNKTSRAYEWHIVLDDGMTQSPAPGERVLAVDMGEIHPAVVADHEQAVVVSCRALRACKQYGFKRRAKLSSLRDTKKRGSRRRQRIQKRMNRFNAQQKRRQKDMLHKISRAVVDHAVARGAGKIVVGDVRGVAHGVDLGKKVNQKISGWEHGRLRRYITYKAERVGMEVVLQDEHFTSQTCPVCGHRKKPSGRIYQCGACGGVFHRDVVGAVNILSAHLHGEPGHIRPPIPKYRRPFLNGTLRSRADTPELARSSPGDDREAAELAPM